MIIDFVGGELPRAPDRRRSSPGRLNRADAQALLDRVNYELDDRDISHQAEVATGLPRIESDGEKGYLTYAHTVQVQLPPVSVSSAAQWAAVLAWLEQFPAGES